MLTQEDYDKNDEMYESWLAHLADGPHVYLPDDSNTIDDDEIY